MLTRSEGSLLLGEDVTLVSRGVSQWESADLRPRRRSDGANRPSAHWQITGPVAAERILG